MGDFKINGHEASIASTTPNALQALQDHDELLKDWNEEHDNNEVYLFDKEFRATYFKGIADIIINWEEEDFNPGTEFFADGDFEVSKIREARTVFLANAGMISV